MLKEIEQLEARALAELDAASGVEGVEAWRIAYLGTKGALKGLMPRLKDVSREEKPAVGKRLNEIKGTLESAFSARKESISTDSSTGPMVDVTQPAPPSMDRQTACPLPDHR